MPLNNITQTVIAFKNISGKSNTDETLKSVLNEGEGIFFNVDGSNVWLDKIAATPSIAIAQGTVISVTADMVLDSSSNNHAYLVNWPSTPPIGLDTITGINYAYGTGLLTGISAGDRVRGSIPPSYNNPPTPGYSGYDFIAYTGNPGNSGNQIFPGDSRSWYYQYNSGIFYQQDVNPVPAAPVICNVNVYVGKKLNSIVDSKPTNIRYTAYNVNSYTASTVPKLGTYSSNYLYLVDFINSNTSGTVSLNLDGLGPINLIKSGPTGLGPLLPGDILGATGGTAGQIYYLTYDGSNFQVYNNNPSQQPSTYTNLNPVPQDIGGFSAGETFSNVTFNTLFTTLLYPQSVPTITSLAASGPSLFTPKEVGDSLIPGNYTFTWNTSFGGNVVNPTTFIKQYSPTSSVTLISGTSNSGNITIGLTGGISLSSPGSYFYKVGFTRTNGTTEIESLEIPWYYKSFYGTSTYSVLDPTSFQNLSSSKLGSVSTGLYDLPKGITASYKYFALPDAFPNIEGISYLGLPFITADSDDGYTLNAGSFFGNYKLLTIINAFGVSVDYRIYRSKNTLGATLSAVSIK
jgi:hypothetical protein